MTSHIEKIFEREREIRSAMVAGKAIIDIPPQFRIGQMGLRPVYADDMGQLWTIIGDNLVLVSKPEPNGWASK